VITLKSRYEVEKIRFSCGIVAEVLNHLGEVVAPGATTLDLEKIAEELIRKKKVKPAFKGYHGYPCCLCTSINEEVVHGIPSSKRVLKSGDIVGVDVGVIHDGYYGDAAKTFAVGVVSPEVQMLLTVTEESLYKGIEQAVDGNRLSDISHAIQRHAEAAGYSAVRDFVGHGIGRMLHEEPQVPNYGPPGKGPKLKSGMVLALEPMINQGRYEVEVLEDGWTAVTADRKLSAHFEHTIVVTEDGPVILSRLDDRQGQGTLQKDL